MEDEESYVEVQSQGGFYLYFHVQGDDRNKYMSLDELLRYHPEATDYVSKNRQRLEREYEKGEKRLL